MYYLLIQSLLGRIVLGKYKNYGIVDLYKLKSIVIYHYMEKDPVDYV